MEIIVDILRMWFFTFTSKFPFTPFLLIIKFTSVFMRKAPLGKCKSCTLLGSVNSGATKTCGGVEEYLSVKGDTLN